MTTRQQSEQVAEAISTWADAIEVDRYDAISDKGLLAAVKELNSAIAAQARRKAWKGWGKKR